MSHHPSTTYMFIKEKQSQFLDEVYSTRLAKRAAQHPLEKTYKLTRLLKHFNIIKEFTHA
jgi:hypothetical protein